MSINIDKYVDLVNRYAIYGENGYYIDPFIIGRMIVDELKLSMSYVEIGEFINNASINIKAEEIKRFLKEKLYEEQPDLPEKLKNINNNETKIAFTSNKIEEERKIDTSSEKMKDLAASCRYTFEPYSLEYFKTYVAILKEKCITLFDIVDNLRKIKSDDEISGSDWERILDLDFHINENGDIYASDAVRLAEAIVYNVKDLHDKVTRGNNYETYLTFKESKLRLLKEGISENEMYPKKEVQIKNLNYAYSEQFIELSENQKKQLEEEKYSKFVLKKNKKRKNKK